MLFKILKDHKVPITNLELNGNKLDDDCISSICDYLVGNTNLKHLSLQQNKGITDASVEKLIDATKNSHLANLDLSGTQVSEEKKQLLKKHLSFPIEKRNQE